MTTSGGHRVLLLHHAAGGASDWREVVEALGSGVEALVPDLPGHGARVAEAPLDSIEALASHVAGIVRERGGGPVVAVGHSMGGAVALQLALDHPELVAGLVMISTGARFRVARTLLDLVREHFSELPQRMVAMGFLPSADPAVVRRYVEGPWPASPEAAYADFVACDRFDVRVRLGEVRVPAAVMVGDEDLMTPVKRARELADGISGARLTIVPGAGHLIIWERPRDVAGEILAVCDAASRRSA